MACRWPGSAHDEQGRRCWRSRAACCVRVPRPGCHPARRCFAARAACSALAPPPRAPRARLSVERTPRRRSWAWGNLRAQGQACCSARSWTLARFSVASRSELALWGSRPARARVAPRMPWEPRGAPAPGLRRLAMAGPAPGIRAGSPDRVCRSLALCRLRCRGGKWPAVASRRWAMRGSRRTTLSRRRRARCLLLCARRSRVARASSRSVSRHHGSRGSHAARS